MSDDKVAEWGRRLVAAGYPEPLLGEKGQHISGKWRAPTGELWSSSDASRMGLLLTDRATQGVVWGFLEEMAGTPIEAALVHGGGGWHLWCRGSLLSNDDDRLEAMVLAAEELHRRKETRETFCLDCGPHIRTDEDGCCAECGRDARGDWVGKILQMLATAPPEPSKPHLPTKLAPGVWVQASDGSKGFIICAHKDGWFVVTPDEDLRPWWPSHSLKIIPTPELP